MKQETRFDLLGIGLGPFNLSLASLLDKHGNITKGFLDNKSEFSWHQELMFADSVMQTSYLKDLVTPVDPTSPYSFLNYLVENGMFYHFMNTKRQNIHRCEFQAYCGWVSKKLEDCISFNSLVENVTLKNEIFEVKTSESTYYARNICVGSGPSLNIPEAVKPFLGSNVFHAKSKELKKINFVGKRVLIIGGGQTGVEIFRNALKEKWGKADKVTLISGRENLQPLDEGAFTNELFTPSFVNEFFAMDKNTKSQLLEKQLLASDGNTPQYLEDLYKDLYLDYFYHEKFSPYQIAPSRWMEKVEKDKASYKVVIDNLLLKTKEELHTDIIILATGLKSVIPQYLEGVYHLLKLDEEEKLVINKDYSLAMKEEVSPLGKIYGMNFSRHCHGIADPQISLMAWRSAVIANDILAKNYYKVTPKHQQFLKFDSLERKEER